MGHEREARRAVARTRAPPVHSQVSCPHSLDPRAAPAKRHAHQLQAIMPAVAQTNASTAWQLGGCRPSGATAPSACRPHAQVRRRSGAISDSRHQLQVTWSVVLQSGRSRRVSPVRTSPSFAARRCDGGLSSGTVALTQLTPGCIDRSNYLSGGPLDDHADTPCRLLLVGLKSSEMPLETIPRVGIVRPILRKSDTGKETCAFDVTRDQRLNIRGQERHQVQAV